MTLSIRKAFQEERRKKYLSGLINEAIVQILSEQDAAAAPMGMPAPAAPPADVSAPPAPEANADKPKEFTVDDMIERLNVIRGGRSFTDPEVYGQLVTYFKTLSDEQKTAMETFLMDLGKIVINVNEQESPPSPEVSAAPPATPPAPAAVPPAPTAPAPVA